MDAIVELIKSKKDLESKSPSNHNYELEIRLKEVSKEEFESSIEISNDTIDVTTVETLYAIKGNFSAVVTCEIDSVYSIKEKIASKMINDFKAETLGLTRRNPKIIPKMKVLKLQFQEHSYVAQKIIYPNPKTACQTDL
ncbi:unnamed protein product [Calypogeia fissa]